MTKYVVTTATRDVTVTAEEMEIASGGTLIFWDEQGMMVIAFNSRAWVIAKPLVERE